MACARATPTPNPNAMKFVLDVTLDERILAHRGDASDDPFVRALLDVDGVESVFGINDFVTVTRAADADWTPIVCAVEVAAANHLPGSPAAPPVDAVERARALLRAAIRPLAGTAVEIRSASRPTHDDAAPSSTSEDPAATAD